MSRVHVDPDTGVRYLEDTVYEREPGGNWRVPDDERDRWDNPPRVTRPAPAALAARPLPDLLAELEAVTYVDDVLSRRLTNAHRADGARTTRLVEHTIQQTIAGELRNPAGLLWRRLDDIAQRPEPPPT